MLSTGAGEAKDGEEALTIFNEKNPDIVILDIEIPKIDGLEVARKIREKSNDTKIIMLTAHSDKPRLLKAIKLNLTDYLIKPVNRIDLKNLLNKTFNDLEKTIKEDKIFLDKNKEFSIDPKSFLLYKNNELVELSKYEIKALSFLYSNKNKVIPKIDIFNYIWDDFDKEFNDANIRNLIKNLRKKLPENTIESVYGGGYIFKTS